MLKYELRCRQISPTELPPKKRPGLKLWAEQSRFGQTAEGNHPVGCPL